MVFSTVVSLTMRWIDRDTHILHKIMFCSKEINLKKKGVPFSMNLTLWIRQIPDSLPRVGSLKDGYIAIHALKNIFLTAVKMI